MAALSITTADFRIGSLSARSEPGVAAEAIDIMDPLYLDSNGQWAVASNASQAASVCTAFATSKADAQGDYVSVMKVEGATITPGATLVAGDTYYLGASGAIIPMADLATNNWVTALFIATSTTEAKTLFEALEIQAA